MKKFGSLVYKKAKALWADESAQGATEYILLLAIVVGVAMLFKKQIMDIISNKLGSISSAVQGFTPEGGGN